MNWKQFNYCFFLVLIFFAASFLPENVEAQEPLGYAGRNGGYAGLPPIMGRVYPSRYRIRGLIELNYWDFKETQSVAGTASESKRKTFQQTYRLGLEGYIIRPRLAVFSTYVTLNDRNMKQNEGSSKNNDINYSLNITALPLRPVSFDLYASRTTGTVGGVDTPSYDSTSNNYGARVTLKPKKIPASIGLKYDYWDYTSELFAGKSKTSRYGLDILGYIKPIRTTYRWNYEFIDYTSTIRNYTSQNLSGDMRTIIKPGDVLHTAFQYSEIDISKMMSFIADLTLNPMKKLEHSYRYSYLRSDTEGFRSESHDIAGAFSYDFTERLRGRAVLEYNASKTETKSMNSYYLNLGLDYRRHLDKFDSFSYYRFSYYNRGTESGKLMTNNIGFNLSTRKIKWGRIYSSYDLTMQTSDFGDATEHRVVLGADGRGPGKLNWNVEVQYTNSKNDMGGTSVLVESVPFSTSIPGARNASYFTFSGSLGHPLGRKGLAALKGSYITGSLDSNSFNSYYYETRINYLIFRNLNLLAWWREGWETVSGGGDFDRKSRDYNIQLNYRWRRLFLSLEYYYWKIDEGSSITTTKNLYLRLRRPI